MKAFLHVPFEVELNAGHTAVVVVVDLNQALERLVHDHQAGLCIDKCPRFFSALTSLQKLPFQT